ISSPSVASPRTKPPPPLLSLRSLGWGRLRMRRRWALHRRTRMRRRIRRSTRSRCSRTTLCSCSSPTSPPTSVPRPQF
ncbi:hypothetical protein AK812_SmicGene47834, partial [Symbiodinium microadriaticum]